MYTTRKDEQYVQTNSPIRRRSAYHRSEGHYDDRVLRSEPHGCNLWFPVGCHD